MKTFIGPEAWVFFLENHSNLFLFFVVLTNPTDLNRATCYDDVGPNAELRQNALGLLWKSRNKPLPEICGVVTFGNDLVVECTPLATVSCFAERLDLRSVLFLSRLFETAHETYIACMCNTWYGFTHVRALRFALPWEQNSSKWACAFFTCLDHAVADLSQALRPTVLLIFFYWPHVAVGALISLHVRRSGCVIVSNKLLLTFQCWTIQSNVRRFTLSLR